MTDEGPSYRPGDNVFVLSPPRPDETKSCVGCHEDPHTTTASAGPPLALRGGPLSFLPEGGEFSYRAKAWFKGSLPPEIEERTRTVHAVNLLAR